MIRRIAIGFLAGLAILMTNSVLAQDDMCFERGGFWDAEAGQCRIQSALSVNIQYPLSLADYPFADEIISAYIQQEQAQFLEFFADSAVSFMIEPLPWELDMTYETYRFSDHIVSLKFEIYQYTGGAHGITYFKTFTFDLTQQRLITLDDIFMPQSNPFAIISPLAQKQVQANLGEYAVEDWIAEGTSGNPANYENFVLTTEALVFFFPPYQVAPYVAGPQTISIPLWQLNDVTNEPFHGAAE
ncbi:MAG: DUF3298/DUF4163 domain-containing protein [Chloroflexi bacterium]|nr:MAG: DUF3298/DUF4163 domain-containing protein [Chloroflexota bacterium]